MRLSLCLLAALTFAGPAFADEDCTDELTGGVQAEADAFDKRAAADPTADPWRDLQRVYAKSSTCLEQGPLGQWADRTVVQLLARRWATVASLAQLVEADLQLRSFIVGHVGAAAAADDLRAVRKQAQSACPDGAQALCSDLAASADDVLADVDRPACAAADKGQARKAIAAARKRAKAGQDAWPELAGPLTGRYQACAPQLRAELGSLVGELLAERWSTFGAFARLSKTNGALRELVRAQLPSNVTGAQRARIRTNAANSCPPGAEEACVLLLGWLDRSDGT